MFQVVSPFHSETSLESICSVHCCHDILTLPLTSKPAAAQAANSLSSTFRSMFSQYRRMQVIFGLLSFKTIKPFEYNFALPQQEIVYTSSPATLSTTMAVESGGGRAAGQVPSIKISGGRPLQKQMKISNGDYFYRFQACPFKFHHNLSIVVANGDIRSNEAKSRTCQKTRVLPLIRTEGDR